jgi:hypothetical protein
MSFEGGSQHTLRRYLLGTASGAALIGTAPFAQADTNIDHIYLDVSGQYSLTGGHTDWGFSGHGFGEPQINVKNGFDTRADLALQSGNWYLTLSANFGRTGGSKASISQDAYYSSKYSFTHFHRDGVAKHNESHTVVDFTLGKDVGLGMMDLEGSSIVSLGVRYMHFVARTRSHLNYSTFSTFLGSSFFTSTSFNRQLDRQFVGWGPVITWKAKAPISPEFSFSWGLTAAAVIGGRSFEIDGVKLRHNEIISPQVGGYVGLNWQMPDSPFDLTIGYRGDGYFDIVDKGFATVHHADRIIHGPFAQIGWQVE